MIMYPQPFKKVSILKDVDVTYTTTMVDDNIYSTLTDRSTKKNGECEKSKRRKM